MVGTVQFDHLLPVALGGKATVDNLRLLCPAHNQYEAERLLGTNFMEMKRQQSERLKDVATALRSLRAKPSEARLAAEHALTAVPEASLEEQIRVALKWFRPAPPTRPAQSTRPAQPTRPPHELVPA